MKAIFYKGEDITLTFISEVSLADYTTKIVKFFTPFSIIKEAVITVVNDNTFTAKMAKTDTAELEPGRLNIVVEFNDSTGNAAISKTIEAEIKDAYIDGGERETPDTDNDIVFLQSNPIYIKFNVDGTILEEITLAKNEVSANKLLLGGIAYNASAPTPGKNGIYEFLSGGSCSWITGGAVTVSNGDRVIVIYNSSNQTYTYTYQQNTSTDLQQVMGSKTSRSVSQKAIESSITDSVNMIIKMAILTNSFSIVKKVPTITMSGYYINYGGILSGGGSFSGYKVEVYTISNVINCLIVGKTQGAIAAISYYSDSGLTQNVGIGVYNTSSSTVLTVADSLRNIPTGANYVALTINNSIALDDRLQVISVDAFNNTNNYLTKLLNNVLGDTNTLVAISESRNGYYIDAVGTLSGGGTFIGYAIDLYPVVAGNSYKLLGQSAGSISTAAFYTDSTLATRISIVNAHYENTTYDVNLKIIAPTNATIIAVVRRTSLATPTKLYTYVVYDHNNLSDLQTQITALDLIASDLQTQINELNNVTKTVVCWGDSLTAGAGGNGTTYPGVLQALIGSDYTVYNAGVGGENTYTIAGRQGGEPILIASDFTLPSNTDIVTVQISNALGKSISTLIQGGSSSINPCYVDGIECTLSRVDSDYKVRRNVAGTSSRSIKSGIPIITNYIKTKRKPYAMVLFMGTNGSFTDGNDLADQYDKMIRFAGINNYVIVGMHGLLEPEVLIPIEQIFQSKYGANFINWRQYVSTHGLEDAGITPSQSDLTAMSEGKCPPSLRTDTIHLTATGYTLLGNLIYQRFKDLGIF